MSDIAYCIHPLIIFVFLLGYIMIILEHYIHVNKTAIALFVAVLCWCIYFISHIRPLAADLLLLGEHVNDIAQIIFFLMGAMTIVELIDVHKGFTILTDLIRTNSKRKLLLIIASAAFLLSAVLDNLTTSILMISLLRKLIPYKKDRFLLACVVIIAANAGGAWTPIGDVTTSMLWINGQISSWSIMKSLLLPSVVSLVVPVALFMMNVTGKTEKVAPTPEDTQPVPGGRLIFFLGLGALIFVPIFKALTGLPPFMGMLIGVAVLWLVTDIRHRRWEEERMHLRVPYVLSKIDTSGVLFFLGILLCVDALETVGLLQTLATWLSDHIPNQAFMATLIGIISAIIDNVPLVAATMGMYSLEQFPMDHTLWHMIAYAAGVGGSLFIIGSAAGVAVMGMEKIDFVSYMKQASLPIFLGYLAGMGVYLLCA